MKVKDFGVGVHLPLLSASKLWEREVDKVKTLDLDVFLRGFADTSLLRQARTEVDLLLESTWEYAVRTQTDPPSMIAFAEPPPRITVDELVEWLSTVSLERRRAILFCLETGMSIDSVVELTWKKLNRLDISEYAMKIARSQVQHLKLPYVFWERVGKVVAVPLVGLGESMLMVSQGMGYQRLRSRYLELIPVSYSHDYESAELRLLGTK